MTGTTPPSGRSSPPLPPEAAASTTRVGPFILTAKLGAGGMGEVWKAWDTRLSRWIALKFLKGSDDDEVLRFQREAQTAARLSHPNIAAVHEVGTETSDGPKRHWIAMQFVDGRTLRGLPRQDLRAIVTLVRDAARAIDYAHAEGVVHRDLKPDNLMIDAAGRLFVMDFGLARQTSVNSSLSHSGFAVGTPAYMPPEQARGRSKTADARSDVYSLGATLYELLAGRPPFEGRDVFDLLLRVVEEEPKTVRVHNPRVDADLETIAHKCLEKDPERRYATAAGFADDLDRWLAGEPITARPVSTMERVARRIRRHKAVSASLGALAVLAIVSAALLVVQSQRGRANEERLKKLSLLWADLLEKKRDLWSLNVPIESSRPALERAVAAVDAFAAANPDLPQGWYLKGRGLTYLRRHAGALAAADRAIALASDFGPAHALRGAILADAIHEQWSAWSRTSHDANRRRNLESIEAARAAFARAEAAGLGPEQMLRWGLAPSAEDEELRLAIETTAMGYAGDRAGAVRILEARLAQRRSGECLYLLAVLAESGVQSVTWATRALESAPGDARLWFHRASLRRQEGDYQAARADLDEALRIDPHFLNALANRSNVLNILGDPAAAIRDADAVLAADPASILALFNRADARKALGDHEGAMRDYDEVIRLEPDLATAWNNRGNARRTAGDPAGAIRDITRSLELEPTALSFTARGVAREYTGDRAGALADYGEALRLDADHVPALQARALLLAQLGNLEAALKDADAGVAAAPASPGVRLARGSIHHRLGKIREAMADYDEVIRLDPACADAFSNRGEILTRLGQYAAAKTNLDEAVRLKPGNATALLNRGNARLYLGDPEGAIRDFNESIRYDASGAGAYDGRGVAHHELGKHEEAFSDFAEAIRLDPGASLPRYHRGELRRLRKEYTDAVEDLSEAIRLDPRDAGLYVSRADALQALRDDAGVIRDCDEALRLGSRQPEPWFLRAQARRRRGDLDGAVADFEKALTLLPADSPLRKRIVQMIDDIRAGRK